MLHRKLRTLGVPVVSGLRTGVFAASQFSRHFTAGAASGEDVKYLSDVIHDHESPDWFPERRKKVDPKGDRLRKIAELEEARLSTRYPALKATIRTLDGSRNSRDMREEGVVPSHLYGSNGQNREKINISVLHSVLKKEMMRPGTNIDSFQARAFELHVYNEDESELLYKDVALPTQLVRSHHRANEIMTIGFLRFNPKRSVRVPIVYTNGEYCPVLKRNGWIAYVNDTIRLYCPDGNIPEKIEFDLAGINNPKGIYVEDLELPPGTLVHRNDKKLQLCKIRGKKLAGAAGDDEE